MEVSQVMLPVLVAAVVANTVLLLLVVVVMRRRAQVRASDTRSVVRGSVISASFVDPSVSPMPGGGSTDDGATEAAVEAAADPDGNGLHAYPAYP